VPASLWAFFVSRPYELTILVLACLPLVAIALSKWSNGIFQLEGRRSDPRPSLAVAFVTPGAVLAYRALKDFHLVNWHGALAATVIAAIGMSLVASWADQSIRKRALSLLAALLLNSMYCYGVIVEADAIFDLSAPQTFRVPVLGKRVSGGRSRTRYLRLDHWGPLDTPSEVSVAGPLYRRVIPGQSVCMDLRPGALGLAWYLVSSCSEGLPQNQ